MSIFGTWRLLFLVSQIDGLSWLINELTGLTKNVFRKQLLANAVQFIAAPVQSLAVFATLAVLVVPLPRRCPVYACSGGLVFLWSLVAVIPLQLVAALALRTLHAMRAGRKHCRFLCAASSITSYALLLL